MTPPMMVTDADVVQIRHALKGGGISDDAAATIVMLLADRERTLGALRQMQAECWAGHPEVDYDALDVVSDILKEVGRDT